MRSCKELLIASNQYAGEQRLKSWWHLVSTLGLAATLLTIACLELPLAVCIASSLLASLVLVRLFIISHDDMHGAILSDSRIAGGILRVYGLLVLSPRQKMRTFFLLFASVISATILAAPPEPLPYSVGVAAVDITPTYSIRLNGFGGRTQESAGVRQQIRAKALAIETSTRDTVIVITVDTLGIPDDMTERLAEKLKSKGIDRSRVAICASHTHSGPMIRNCANTLFGQPIADDQWQTILKYTDELDAKLEEVAVAALAARKPARLSWGIGKVTFAMNRRTHGGPVDHDLPLLAVHDPDGRLRAVFTNYACHCVTLSDDMISGDWAGYAMDHIQRRNPGCEALISIGCGADSNPRGGVLGSRADAADSLGQELAEEVQRLLSTKLRPLTKAPESLIERVTLKLAPLPTREEWEERAKQQNAIGHHARTQLARLDRSEALMTEISYPIQSISFGDELAWVFLPGEVVVDYALGLKRELDGGRLWLNAYSNACPGYVPSERILGEGGYEGGAAMVYYDIPGPYATGVEQTIVDSVEKQLKARIPAAVDTAKTNGVAPLVPSDAVLSLRTKPGFRAELVASEPLIESPVAIAFGTDGRLWVAEMSDYPQGKAESGKPKAEDGGQIRCVYDDNSDGDYDRSEVFLTGIPFPTGVTVWRNGVLVCAAPDILYAEDTNGDGKADDVRKLFTGFATHNYQARVNSLEYGLDDWVYGSCGLFGGEITSVQTGEVIALSQRDFRFNPDTGVLEPATGATQQGRVRNDWGDWFGCNNGTMLMHYPLADQYLRRNPYLAPSQTVMGIAAGPDPGRLFSISSQVLFMLSGPPNRPTAACGLGIYRDNLLGAEYAGNAFTCEPVNNLVHRQILTPGGVTFTSRRDHDELDREFLASTDPWFRPVQARTGPDGALWVVDMYRYVIEHPIWIPPDTLATLDPRAGATMGRIYRVVPNDDAVRRVPRLDQLRGRELVAAMDSPNGTQRDLVQQLIQWWQNDKDTIPALRQLCVDSVRPEVRVQALSTWANLEPPAADVMLKMPTDTDPHVRSHAVRVAESQLNASVELTAAVVKLADDGDAFLRMQVAYSAGFLKPADSAVVLAKIMAKDGRNTHLKSAVESSLTSANVVRVLNELRAQPDSDDAADRLLVSAATLADAGSFETILNELSNRVSESAADGDFNHLAEFVDAWSRRSPPDVAPGDNDLHAAWKPAIDAAVHVVENDESQITIRMAAVRLLALAPFLGDPHSESLAALLTPRTQPELQSAAIQALQRDNRPEVADVVLTDWASREPRLRKTGIALLLSRPAWSERLLAAIEAGTVAAGELDLPQQQALLENTDEAIRIAAAKSFKPRTSAGRQEAIDRFTAALHEGGDPGKGRQVFQKHCSNCHRLQDSGHVVGPDIATYGSKPVQSLLIAMLDPNQAVDPRYQSYVAVLKDGRSVTGLIAEETASGLTLLAAEGKRESVLRSEIDEIRSTGKSLMPEGFEQNATTEDMNHLWAYFRTLRVPPKSLEGNQPAIVEVPAQGNVALLASQAEIYGGDVTFELAFQNVGYWHGKDDMVRWQVRSPIVRKMDVWAEWACDANAAGNSYVIEGAEPVLKGHVGSTGAWSRYQLQHLGTVTIREGESDIVIRPEGDLRSALADLRALHLVQLDGVPLAAGMVEESNSVSTSLKTVADIAAFLIDELQPPAEREAIINANLDQAATIIPLMVQGLPEDHGSTEEYRRIPWIWRLAVAVGKHGDARQIHSVLAVSLPQADQLLEHWQAVVIGGGLINGISLSGKWPQEELSALMKDDAALQTAWHRSLHLSTKMADDETVPAGTRYDALRVVAMLGWNTNRKQLERYLQKGVNDELQMGAISGLSDVHEAAVSSILIKEFSNFSDANQQLALDALLRSDDRCLALLTALAEDRLPAKLQQHDKVKALRTHASESVRSLATRMQTPK